MPTRLPSLCRFSTNHQWSMAEILSDITYDHSDDSFWLVKMISGKADSIEHRSRDGVILPGGFTTKKDMDIEAITVSTIDNTLWMSDVRSKSILHFNRLGNDLGDGFKIKESTGVFGMAHDPSDSTLRFIETNARKLWHYSINGQMLNSGIDVLPVGRAWNFYQRVQGEN